MVQRRRPATEVARRAGHSVAVLLKVYANCIDGQSEPANRRIDTALNEMLQDLEDTSQELDGETR